MVCSNFPIPGTIMFPYINDRGFFMASIFETARIVRVKGLSNREMREYVHDAMQAQSERERASPATTTKGKEHGQTDDGNKF